MLPGARFSTSEGSTAEAVGFTYVTALGSCVLTPLGRDTTTAAAADCACSEPGKATANGGTTQVSAVLDWTVTFAQGAAPTATLGAGDSEGNPVPNTRTSMPPRADTTTGSTLDRRNRGSTERESPLAASAGTPCTLREGVYSIGELAPPRRSAARGRPMQAMWVLLRTLVFAQLAPPNDSVAVGVRADWFAEKPSPTRAMLTVMFPSH